MHSIYIEITCPYVPKLNGLEVCLPGFEMYSCEHFDLKETVEVVSCISLYLKINMSLVML